MRLLLDTHAFLWWVFDDPRLSSAARDLIAEPAAEILFSAVSAWEIAIKARTGRLELPADVPAFVPDQVRRNRFQCAAGRAGARVARPRAARPPPRSVRPLLVAQAQVEAVPLLSRDTQLAAYEVDLRWWKRPANSKGCLTPLI